jgi:hypothetical protein
MVEAEKQKRTIYHTLLQKRASKTTTMSLKILEFKQFVNIALAKTSSMTSAKSEHGRPQTYQDKSRIIIGHVVDSLPKF